MKIYRDNGAIGALLDEYEKAINELLSIIEPIDDTTLTTIVDSKTKDKDCRSIQSILSHLVASGYTYAIYLRMTQGEELDFRRKIRLSSTKEYAIALKDMFKYNEEVFKDYPNYNLLHTKSEKKIHTRWGQIFDGDQIMEHAIVHILRHRRQIERFLLKL